MSECSFSLPYEGSRLQLFNATYWAVANNGGQMAGDENSGTIQLPTPAGNIYGKYTAQQGSVAIDITDKPFLVPCSTIEQKMREAIAKVPPAPPASQPPDAGAAGPIDTSTAGGSHVVQVPLQTITPSDEFLAEQARAGKRKLVLVGLVLGSGAGLLALSRKRKVRR